jgi:hypothetical protein
VPHSEYTWHLASDGAATFPTRDGGWILVSNSEELRGGAGAMRFGPDGEIRDAYRILEGTAYNCAGGPTPWATWLSCEEHLQGRVWECDPGGRRKGRPHDAMGVFKHEAAAVDPRGKRVYLTEDLIDGAFYRFTPSRWPSLQAGLLEMTTAPSSPVWPSARAETESTSPPSAPTAKRVRCTRSRGPSGAGAAPGDAHRCFLNGPWIAKT